MKKLLLSLICLSATCCLRAQLAPGSVNTTSNGTIYFYQYKPPHYNNTDLFPLIISLHGVGQGGNPNGSEIAGVLSDGLPLQLSQGKQLEFTWQGKTEGFVMLAPQTNRTGEPAPSVDSWETYYVDEMITYGINNLRVDPARIFLTGFSAGGGGVWKYATSSAAAASKLAGIFPAASSDLGSNYCNIASSQVAVWTFHGGSDGLIPGHTDNAKAAAVNACSPLLVPAVDTLIQNEGHGIYNNVTYDFTNNSHYPNVFQWALKVNRNLNTTTNAIPVPVVAGSTSYTFPAPFKAKDFPILDGSGSTDADDIIMDYLWAQTAGPALILTDNLRPKTFVQAPSGNVGIAAGNYSFVFRVKDYLTSKVNNKGNHTQTVTVNLSVTLPTGVTHAAPAVDAGTTVTLQANVSDYKRTGGTAYAYGCTSNCFSGVNWAQVPQNQGGGLPVSLKSYNDINVNYSTGSGEVWFANINTAGTYKFQYAVTNTFGETGTDIFTIIKLANSALPVSYAYFNGKNAGNTNELTWATTQEINSDRFDIMRSTDGLNFTGIGSVNSKGGSIPASYVFDDANAPFGLAYYRLTQVDKDGSTAYSKIISVNNNKAGLYIERYPNPVHDNLIVSIQGVANGSIQVLVADMQGKTIMQQQWQKDQPQLKKTLNVAALQNGVYQMIIISGQEKKVSSFVKY